MSSLDARKTNGGSPRLSWNSRNLRRIAGVVATNRPASGVARGRGMGVRFGMTAIAAAATLSCLGTGYAVAGDDGAAPLWTGIGSIFGPVLGFSKDEQAPIDYREHGKIVLPPKMDLPPPESTAAQGSADWPVNQEVQRKRFAKEEAKKQIAGQGDARLRYTHPFPNAPVTVRAEDQQEPSGASPEGKAATSSVLGSLKSDELGWNGQERSARSRTGPRVADRSAERLPGRGRADWAGRQLTIGSLKVSAD